ncbi:hypothetical protein G7Y89_g1708 [Cudoniella acicularis]|uniref:Involucrin repeat protein n=1 Tax=Cudoniella acicularis TaxID=354080 RepID=A0A8H4RVU2_9HELO|nr:hypothetical protein G7Y89_g1708 [Cudoniella acicularis]
MMADHARRRHRSPESSSSRNTKGRKESRRSQPEIYYEPQPQPQPQPQPRMRPPPMNQPPPEVYLSSSNSSASSFELIDISRTFPANRGGIKAFFTAPSEHRRRLRRRSSNKRLFKFGNSSSSSVNSDLAYGTGYLKRPKRSVRSRRGKEIDRERHSERTRGSDRERYSDRERERARGSDRERYSGSERRGNTNAEILAVGAGLAKLARDQNKADLKAARNGKRPEVVAMKETYHYDNATSRGLGPSRISHGSDTFDEDGWESASDAESENSVDSRLAFGGDSAIWGKTRHRPLSQKNTVVDPQLFGPDNSLHGHVDEPVGFGKVTWSSTEDFGQHDRTPSVAIGPGDSFSASQSQASLQQVYPQQTSDPSRFDAVRSSVVSGSEPVYRARPDPVPIQQPQPFTPVSQSVFEPSYSAPSESPGILKKTQSSSSSRGTSVAQAALVGAVGVVGMTIASSRKDERSDKRRDRDEEREREEERLRRRDHEKKESKEERRRDKRDESRNSSDEKRKEKKREKRREEARDEPRGERREERREGRRSERSEAAPRTEPRYEDRRPKSEAAVTTVSAVDAFATPTYPTPTVESSQGHRRTDSVPKVVTVEREPDFTRKRSSSIKDQPSSSKVDYRKDYSEYDDRETRYREEYRDQGLRDAEVISKETEHSTTSNAAAAISGAVAVVTAQSIRESKSEKRRAERRNGRTSDYEDRDHDRDYDYSSRGREPVKEEKRDPVQEEADRAYREIVMARKIASQIRSRSNSPDGSVVDKYEHRDEEEEVPEIVTPPEMEHKKKKSPYDAPNADFEPDYILNHPKDLRNFSLPAISYDRSNPAIGFLKRDPDAEQPRPLLNLVRPTPVPSPIPENQISRSESRRVGPSQCESGRSESARSEPTRSSKSQDREEPPRSSASDVVIGSRGNVVASPSPSTISKAVTWGENETKHFDVESPSDNRDEYISSADLRSHESPPESKPEPKSSGSRGWGAIVAGVVGVGVGAAAASSIDSSEKSKSKDESYEYRGVVVEPESPPSRSQRRRSPPSPGPKPVSQPSPPSHIPGAFDDDLDFTATVAAGLQDTGFDPNIVINDPSFHRRDSPPGSNELGGYRAPFAETVSDLGQIPTNPSAVSGSSHGFIMGEVDATPRDWRSASPDIDETPTKPSKKEQKKREKAAKRQSVDVDIVEATPAPQEDIPEPESYFEPKLSKKEQKKREKEAKRQSSLAEDITPIVEQTVARELVDEPEEYFEPTKKSKKSKRESAAFDDDVPVTSPDTHRESRTVSVPINAFDDLRNEGDDWDEPKKSKKKSKRDSERFDSPIRSAPPIEIIERERSSSRKSVERSGDYDRDPREVSLPPSTPSETSQDRDYEDSRRSRKSSTRDSSIFDARDRGDSRSVVSESTSRYDDEPRKKKKSRSSTKDDFDDARSVASAPAGDEESRKSRKKDKEKEKEKEKKSSGFFGMFSSKSDVGAREESSKTSKDDFEDVKKKKKSKRSSVPDSSSLYGDMGATSVSDLSRSVSNGHSSRKHDDDLDSGVRSDGERERRKTRSRAESSSSKKDSFLGNAGTLGAGVGLAGAAVAIAAQQHQQSKAAEAFEEAVPQDRHERRDRSTRRPNVFDYEITEREIRPSIDPQYGDLLPLPPSEPESPEIEPLDDLPGLPESRPTTPEAERLARERARSSVRKNLQETPVKSPSQSAVPLKFIMGNRSVPPSPGLPRSSPMQSPSTPNAESLTFPRSRVNRPTSWDSAKEYRPLYLLESSRRESNVHMEQDELLPALPPSQASSRSSSQFDFEDLAKVRDPEQFSSELHDRLNDSLSIDIERASSELHGGLLDSEQSTPKAAVFPRDIELEEFEDVDSKGISSQPRSRKASPRPDESGKSSDIDAMAIGGAVLATTIGLIASSTQEQSAGEESDELLLLKRQPEPVEPMTKDRSSYLLQSSPISKNDDVGSETPTDTSPSRRKPSYIEADSMQSIQERDGDAFGQEDQTPEDLEQQRSRALEVLSGEPRNDDQPADEFFFTKLKKDKKGKSKGKGLSRSSTQDDLTLPEASSEAMPELPALVTADEEEFFMPKSKKDKKKDKKKGKASAWEPEPEEKPFETTEESQREIVELSPALVENEPFKEPATSSKKGKKKDKKGKSKIAWEETEEPTSELPQEPLPEPSQEVIENVTTPAESQPFEDVPTTFKKGKKKDKKGKSKIIWEPEDAPVPQDSVESTELNCEIVEEESTPIESTSFEEVPPTSKAGKKGKKGKSKISWEPENVLQESEERISDIIEPSREVLGDEPLPNEAEAADEFTPSKSKKDKKKDKKKGKSTPILEPETELPESSHDIPPVDTAQIHQDISQEETQITQEAESDEDVFHDPIDEFIDEQKETKSQPTTSDELFSAEQIPENFKESVMEPNPPEQPVEEEPEPFVVSESKKAKKKGKKSKAWSDEPESSQTATPDADRTLETESLDPTPIVESPEEFVTKSSKKGKKKNRKSQAFDPEDAPIIQTPNVEESVSSKPTPMVGPGAWPVTPAIPLEGAEKGVSTIPSPGYFQSDAAAQSSNAGDLSDDGQRKEHFPSFSTVLPVATLATGAAILAHGLEKDGSSKDPESQSLDANDPEQPAPDGLAARHKEDQLELAKRLQEEFGSGSKNGKKDKKKRQSLPSTPDPESSRSRIVAEPSDMHPRARSLSIGPAAEGDQPIRVYSEGQLELARQLKAEFEKGNKKSRKDKKKRLESAGPSGWGDTSIDQPAQESASKEIVDDGSNQQAMVDTPKGDGFAAGYQEAQLSLARQLQAEFGSGAKKGKKDKKRRSTSQTPREDSRDEYFDAPQPQISNEPRNFDSENIPKSSIASDGLAAGYKEDQLEHARQLKEEFGKKSKKDKKRRSTSQTPLTEESRDAYFEEPQSFLPDELQREGRPQIVEPGVEGARDGLAAGYNEGQLELARQLKEEFGSDSKKGKKGKKDKKRQSLSRTRTEDDFSSDMPTEEQASAEVGESSSGPIAAEPEDEFAPVEKKSKKDKKGKKRESLLRSTTDDNFSLDTPQLDDAQNHEAEPEVLTSQLETSSSVPEPTAEDDSFFSSKKSKKDKKNKKRESLLQSNTDDVPEASQFEVVQEPTIETEEPAQIPEPEDGFGFSTKKSKKDKRGKKRESLLRSNTDDVPEASQSETVQERELESDIPTPQVEAPAPAAEPGDEFAFVSKKSKKGKKRESLLPSASDDIAEPSLSEAVVEREVEPEIPTPQPEEPQSEAVLEREVESEILTPQPEEPTPEVPGDEFAFVSKKSKKDKKGKKRDSLLPSASDDIVEASPSEAVIEREVEPEISTPQPEEPQSKAVLEREVESEILTPQPKEPTPEVPGDDANDDIVEAPPSEAVVEQDAEPEISTPQSEEPAPEVADDEFAFVSKKSKKEKKSKKRDSLLPSATDNNLPSEDVDAPRDIETTALEEPVESVAADEPLPESESLPAIEEPVSESKDELEFAMKKSKKDKKGKKRESLLQSATWDNDIVPEPSQTEVEGAVSEIQEPKDDFEFTMKKSKKDKKNKKRESLLQSATEDSVASGSGPSAEIQENRELDVSQSDLVQEPETSEPKDDLDESTAKKSKKDKKSKKRDSLLHSTTDEALDTSSKDVKQAPEIDLPTQPPLSEAIVDEPKDHFEEFSTEKSINDNEGQKSERLGDVDAPSDFQAENSKSIEDIGVPQPDFAQEPLSQPVVDERKEDLEFSMKKSKKDKKGKKRESSLPPLADSESAGKELDALEQSESAIVQEPEVITEPVSTQPEEEFTFTRKKSKKDKKGKKRDSSIPAASNDEPSSDSINKELEIEPPAVLPVDYSIATPDEPIYAPADDDGFAFSTKKSKKDKKSKKRDGSIPAASSDEPPSDSRSQDLNEIEKSQEIPADDMATPDEPESALPEEEFSFPAKKSKKDKKGKKRDSLIPPAAEPEPSSETISKEIDSSADTKDTSFDAAPSTDEPMTAPPEDEFLFSPKKSKKDKKKRQSLLTHDETSAKEEFKASGASISLNEEPLAIEEAASQASDAFEFTSKKSRKDKKKRGSLLQSSTFDENPEDSQVVAEKELETLSAAVPDDGFEVASKKSKKDKKRQSTQETFEPEQIPRNVEESGISQSEYTHDLAAGDQERALPTNEAVPVLDSENLDQSHSEETITVQPSTEIPGKQEDSFEDFEYGNSSKGKALEKADASEPSSISTPLAPLTDLTIAPSELMQSKEISSSEDLVAEELRVPATPLDVEGTGVWDSFSTNKSKKDKKKRKDLPFESEEASGISTPLDDIPETISKTIPESEISVETVLERPVISEESASLSLDTEAPSGMQEIIQGPGDDEWASSSKKPKKDKKKRKSGISTPIESVPEQSASIEEPTFIEASRSIEEPSTIQEPSSRQEVAPDAADDEWTSSKKSKRDKKKRKSGLSTPFEDISEQAKEVELPLDTIEASSFTAKEAEQLPIEDSSILITSETSQEPTFDDWAPSKKSKKNKKARSGISTPIESLPEFSEAIQEPIDIAQSSSITAKDIVEEPAEIGESRNFATHDSVTEPVEDEWAPVNKKSKKEKKRKSGISTPVETVPDISDTIQTPLPTVVKEIVTKPVAIEESPIDTQEPVVEPVQEQANDEWAPVNKKSKKEKKRKSGVSTPINNFPEQPEVMEGPADHAQSSFAITSRDLVAEPVQVEDSLAPVSKESVQEAEGERAPIASKDEEVIEPVKPVQEPLEPISQKTNDDFVQLPFQTDGQSTEPMEDEWASAPSKKSKKDKKKRKSGVSTPMEEMPESSKPAEPVDDLPIISTIPAKEVVEKTVEPTREPETPADNEWAAAPTKKSKKRQEAQEVPLIPSEDAVEKTFEPEQLPESTVEDEWAAAPSKKSKKEKKRKSVASTPLEESPESPTPAEEPVEQQIPVLSENVIERVFDPAEIPETLADDTWAIPSSKKSKKDKKRQSGVSTPLEEPESSKPAEEPTEEQISAIPSENVVERALEPEELPQEPADDEWAPTLSKKSKKDKKRKSGLPTALDTVSEPAQPAVESIEKEMPTSSENVIEKSIEVEEAPKKPAEDEWALPSSKKSKKDKKRKSGLSTPLDEVPIDTAPVEEPIVTSTSEHVLEESNPVPQPVDDDWAPTPSKKSKKDKKKAKSGISTPTEEVLEKTSPIDEEIAQPVSILPSSSRAEEPQIVQEPVEDNWAPIPSKKSKKDKRKSSISTPVEDLEKSVPVTERESPPDARLDDSVQSPSVVEEVGVSYQEAVTEIEKPSDPEHLPSISNKDDILYQNLEDESSAPITSREIVDEPTKSIESTVPAQLAAAALGYAAEKAIEMPSPAVVERDVAEENAKPETEAIPIPELSKEPVEEIPEEEASYSLKKSKKDKKKRKSLLSTPAEDIQEKAPIIEEAPKLDSSSVAPEPQITPTNDLEARPIETPAFDDENKNKDFTRELGAANESSFLPSTKEMAKPTKTPKDIPQEQEDEWAVPSSKKSKKDKKKRKSGASTPIEEMISSGPSEPQNIDSKISEEPIQQPIYEEPAEIEPVIQEPIVENIEKDQGEVDDGFGFVAKKSKKDKKGKRASRGNSVSEVKDISPKTSAIPLESGAGGEKPSSEIKETTEEARGDFMDKGKDVQVDEMEGFSGGLSRAGSKKDKRKRQATTDANMTDGTGAKLPLISWADDVEEAEVERKLPVIEDIAKDESLSHIARTTESSPIDDFVRPTKKGKKGKKRQSGLLESPSFAESSSSPTIDETPKEQSIIPATAALGAGTILAGAAILSRSDDTKNESTAGSNSKTEEKEVPVRKLSKKEKRKMSIDRRTPKDDIFDHDALWEGAEPKEFEESKDAQDDDGDGFWSAPQEDEENQSREISSHDIEGREPTISLEAPRPTTMINAGPISPPQSPDFMQHASQPTTSGPPDIFARQQRSIDLLPVENTPPITRQHTSSPSSHVDQLQGDRNIDFEESPIDRNLFRSSSRFARSGFSDLPVVAEEENPTQIGIEHHSKTHPDLEDGNRDSAFVAESPVPKQVAFANTHEHVRDSGVHLRDNSPLERVRSPASSSDAAIASLAWPPVDEQSETVDLQKSQRPKIETPAKRYHDDKSISRGSPIPKGSPIPGELVTEFFRAQRHLDDTPSRSHHEASSRDTLPSQLVKEEKHVELHRSPTVHHSSHKHHDEGPSSQDQLPKKRLKDLPVERQSPIAHKLTEERPVLRHVERTSRDSTSSQRSDESSSSLHRTETIRGHGSQSANKESLVKQRLARFESPEIHQSSRPKEAGIAKQNTTRAQSPERPQSSRPKEESYSELKESQRPKDGGIAPPSAARTQSPERPQASRLKKESYSELKDSQRPQAERPKAIDGNTVAAGVALVGAAGLGFAAARQLSSEKRPSSAASQRSISNINRMRTPDPKSVIRPESVNSNRSNTPPLRRTDRKISGDLRSLSQRSQLDLAKEAELAAITSAAVNTASTANPTANEGRVRAKDMTDVYDGFGEGRMGSPRSPTRPHSMRRRQSMQVLDLESKVEQLAAENRMLAEAKAQAERTLQSSQKNPSALVERDAEIDALKRTLDWLQNEVTRLTEVNEGLTSANVTLGNQQNERYKMLETQHAQTSRELQETRDKHTNLTSGLEGVVLARVQSAVQEKDQEIAQLRAQLESAKTKIREMQRQILESKSNDIDFLTVRDEDYFDNACQQLCQHVQQWVLRFSKFSDMRACRLTSEINNDKTIDRLDNAILDGSDVDGYLSDRVKRRDVFMSMTMTMVWEFIFTRYLFGMDREQRQKLKSLEKLLSEVGPPAAVHQWRATTLTLLSKREAFVQQREQDTQAVVHAVLETLSEILPPPSNLEGQIEEQLKRVMKAAVDLSIEMRTQRAEYMMLPPLQPEYDANGELARKVSFNAALMNERSGDTISNEDLENQKAVVRIVLFPLVVKKGDDRGEGDEEIVVCPAQVLVAKPKKSVRLMGPDDMTHQNHSRISMQSSMPADYGASPRASRGSVV